MSATEKTLVSVIIPCYNRGSVVSLTLKSVYYQTHRPLELVLIDDGSNDNTFNVLAEFKNAYSSSDFIVILNKQKNCGAPSARNLGFRISSGNLIQFLDSDDLLHPDKISRQLVEFHEDKDVDVVVCDYCEIDTRGGVIGYHANISPVRKAFRGHSVWTAAPLIKRNLVSLTQWDVTLPKHQDTDYILRLFLYSCKVKYVPACLCYYVQHDNFRIRDIYRTFNTNKFRIIINVWKAYGARMTKSSQVGLIHILSLTSSILWKVATHKIKFLLRFLMKSLLENRLKS